MRCKSTAVVRLMDSLAAKNGAGLAGFGQIGLSCCDEKNNSGVTVKKSRNVRMREKCANAHENNGPGARAQDCFASNLRWARSPHGPPLAEVAQ